MKTTRRRAARRDTNVQSMVRRPAMIEALEGRMLLTIAAPVTYPVGPSPDPYIPNAADASEVTGKFITGDKNLDLVISHTSNNSVYFLKGNGNGTFQPAVQINVGQAIQGDVFAGDFNRDGKLDLLLISSNNQAIVLLGNGNGTFKQPLVSTSFNTPNYYPRGWVVGDFNKDGKLDIAFGLPSNSLSTGDYGVCLGNGNGAFAAPIFGTPGWVTYPRWVTAGDFNHDGKMDLAFADGQGSSNNPNTAEMTVLLGNGDGTFHLGGHYASPQFPNGAGWQLADATSNPENVMCADLTGNGILDIVESDYSSTVNVYIGNGDGTFQPAVSYAVGNYPRNVVAADINHDGKMDLIVTGVGIGPGGAIFSQVGAQAGSVDVLLGYGDGTFQQPIVYNPSAYPGYTAAGDFNNDGYPDLAVTQVLDGTNLSVMLNNPKSADLPPTFVNPPSSTPSPVTSKTAVLSALGADDGGAANIKYTWSTVGASPGPVKYSVNGANSAQNTTVTFTKPGQYIFACKLTDKQGVPVIQVFTVNVNATLNSIKVTPAQGSVAANGTLQFTAAGYDQFGNQLSSAPGVTWSVSGGGTISASGLFTAGSAAGGGYTVTAKAGNVSGVASVTITGGSVWTGKGANSNWSNPANWSNKAVPGPGATVVFNNTSSKSATVDSAFAGTVGAVVIAAGYTGTISLGRNLTVVGGFAQAAGTFAESNKTLSVAGDFSHSGGVFSAGAGTLVMNSKVAGQNLSANGVAFNNFTLANGAFSLNITGTLTVNGTFTWLNTAGYILGPGGGGPAYIECRGNVDGENHGGTGQPYLTLDGTGNQTIEDTSGVTSADGHPGGFYREMTINKAAGTVILACDPVVFNGLSLLKGTITDNGNWFYVGSGAPGGAVSSAPGLNLGNITINSNFAAGELLSGTQVANLNLNGHSLVLPATVYVSGNLNAAASTLTSAGSTLVFDGKGVVEQLTSGGNALDNLTINAGAVVQLQDNLTLTGTLTVNGTLQKNGHLINGK